MPWRRQLLLAGIRESRSSHGRRNCRHHIVRPCVQYCTIKPLPGKCSSGLPFTSLSWLVPPPPGRQIGIGQRWAAGLQKSSANRKSANLQTKNFFWKICSPSANMAIFRICGPNYFCGIKTTAKTSFFFLKI
jgi:hypothetical protein